MGSLFAPYLLLIKIGLALVLAGAGYYLGRQSVHAEWNEEKAAVAQAENKAILRRVEANIAADKRDTADNLKITKDGHETLAKVRADSVAAPGLRISAAACSGFAAGAETKTAEPGDGAGAGTRLLPAQTDRDLKSLMQEAEHAAAVARAAQEKFRKIQEEGDPPEVDEE